MASEYAVGISSEIFRRYSDGHFRHLSDGLSTNISDDFPTNISDEFSDNSSRQKFLTNFRRILFSDQKIPTNWV
ncbi:expressed protein [Arabidopsis lyrata subsp. lyrata]|uniref:Expressed protein n=1 Tax=Arabidopsis lyrata subsp. lyrata TaxID=81972 RepID=D7LQ65_ARALL|nr:expressed protein [Arabidopsis lyrata subsp. lyrata]